MSELVKQLDTPRAVWLMVPAASVDDTIATLVPLLSPGDTIIDGGNSYYHDDIRRAAELKPKGIHYLDIGTSGGIWGLDRGYCLMIGGETEVVERLSPIFETLAPGVGAVLARLAAKRWVARQRRATCTVGRPAQVTSSRWCITASNMASWPPMPRA